LQIKEEIPLGDVIFTRSYHVLARNSEKHRRLRRAFAMMKSFDQPLFDADQPESILNQQKLKREYQKQQLKSLYDQSSIAEKIPSIPKIT